MGLRLGLRGRGLTDYGGHAGRFGAGAGDQGRGPGDVAMGGRIQGVTGFGENPTVAEALFAQGKQVGRKVGMGAGEAFAGTGQIVHQGKTEGGFVAGKIDRFKSVGTVPGHFPADLSAQTGFIATGHHAGHIGEEGVEDGLEEMPVLGAAGEKGGEAEFGGRRAAQGRGQGAGDGGALVVKRSGGAAERGTSGTT